MVLALVLVPVLVLALAPSSPPAACRPPRTSFLTRYRPRAVERREIDGALPELAIAKRVTALAEPTRCKAAPLVTHWWGQEGG